MTKARRKSDLAPSLQCQKAAGGTGLAFRAAPDGAPQTVRRGTGCSTGLTADGGAVDWTAPARRMTPVPPNRGMAGRGRGSWPRERGTLGQGSHPRPGPSHQRYKLCPSNRLVTDPSVNTSWMACASSFAMDRTVSLSNFFSCATGSVLVMTTSLIRELDRKST